MASDRATSFVELRREIETADKPYLVLLGTGWGLTHEVISHVRTVLEPIHGPEPYNHLSVRAAAAVILDRLRGTR